MIINLNGESCEVQDGISLSHFLDELKISKQGIAIASKNSVIPKAQWDSYVLADGQELMLIHAVSGG